MHIVVISNMEWQHRDIWFTQFGYCLTISYYRTAKMPSYLFNTAIQDGINYVFVHLSLSRIFAPSE